MREISKEYEQKKKKMKKCKLCKVEKESVKFKYCDKCFSTIKNIKEKTRQKALKEFEEKIRCCFCEVD